MTLLPSLELYWQNMGGKLNGLSLTFKLVLTRFLPTCSISVRNLQQTASQFGESETVSLLLQQVVNLVSRFVL